ncbi:hypothetical protein [Dactylosporangium sp. CA-233914]|uniref:hypothetical protein n=1 Tax=Dactylosporangium sp. CA-233914 TaxID=3239934 RepID=UPI003D8CD67C
MTSLHQRLTSTLNTLGMSADAVADTLLSGGWTGLREDGLNCPVSNYVTAVMPDVEVAAVAFNRITVVSITGETVEAPLPPGAARFVIAFDTGSYDDLAATLTRDDGEVIDDLER